MTARDRIGKEATMRIINGWEITEEKGYGRPPECRPIIFFCVIGPHVKTETRVDSEGLKTILPAHIYEQI